MTPAHSEVATMKLIHTINGSIAPKSVRSSADGVISAHNMMYRHSVTVYDAKTFELLHTVSDSVSLKNFGFGALCFTWRNIPNNTPLVLWYSYGGFTPLFKVSRGVKNIDIPKALRTDDFTENDLPF